ncbi:membrane protein insertion efficiency factor YidD [Microbacterium sp. Marseille-Q6965]|uniref:membrane protein insertion efficiency factor YidD n=1 Tax=Microbacterium sp. Marseille-Q6965 TaxID=2965072 RepID=UPI0021B7BB42|nr:membrane protein insertion efficiency factor YidD [Microbacterium sp. Marseille-Q6965]
MSVLPASSFGTARLAPGDAVRALPLVPRNAGVALLIAYRATISKLYGDVCRYFPSCSAYAVGAVQQYGLVRGSGMALARIARCHPWAAGGVDDVPPRSNFRYDLTPRGFVVPRRKD